MTDGLLGAIDRALAWAFPPRIFPNGMFSDSYWLGLLSGMVVGGYTVASALRRDSVAPVIGIVVVIGLLRLIIWRVEDA